MTAPAIHAGFVRPPVETPGGTGLLNASTNSAADVNRSAGTFARAFVIAASTDAGTVPRTVRSAGTGSTACRAMIACDVGPWKGGFPASIS